MAHFPPKAVDAVVDADLPNLHNVFHCHCDGWAPQVVTPIDSFTKVQWLLGESSGTRVNTGTGGADYDMTVTLGSPGTTTAPIITGTAPYAASGGVRITSSASNVVSKSPTWTTASLISMSAWVMIIGSSPWGRIIEKKYTDDTAWAPPYTGGLMLALDGSGTSITSWVTTGGTTKAQLNGGVISLNEWHLVAVTYDATIGTATLFVDGVQKAQTVIATPWALDWGNGIWETMTDGFSGNTETISGSVWDIRVEPGVIRSASYYAAEYRGALLLPSDVSLPPKVLTSAGLVLDTSRKKFGAASFGFDGTAKDRYICLPADRSSAVPNTMDSVLFEYGEWTCEAWVWLNTLASEMVLFKQSEGPNCALNYANQAGVVLGGTFCQDSFISFAETGNPAHLLTANTWHHIALQHEVDPAGQFWLALYVDGSRWWGLGTGGSEYITRQVGSLYIGGGPSDGRRFNGNIDEIRFMAGRRQYYGSYTVPSGPFADASYPANPHACEIRQSSDGTFYICADAPLNKWRQIVTL